jgi:hypothetical protein
MPTEPAINRDPKLLDPQFWCKLRHVLDQLKAEDMPFRLHEGFRTVDRQQWLYGQGRVSYKPYGRPGKKVTMRDGLKRPSDHQSGLAADCYPAHPDGKIIWPPPPDSDPRWERYATLAEAEGLTAGYRWVSPHDPPHVELRKDK